MNELFNLARKTTCIAAAYSEQNCSFTQDELAEILAQHTREIFEICTTLADENIMLAARSGASYAVLLLWKRGSCWRNVIDLSKIFNPDEALEKKYLHGNHETVMQMLLAHFAPFKIELCEIDDWQYLSVSWAEQ